MLTLYPSIQPYAVHRILVEPPHELYVEECGNPQGLPVLFVHGGPGSHCNDTSRRFFDPNQYRIVLFDQRGAGKSTPHAELENNNTSALIADIEHIRKTLNIDRWILFGGSWGSSLCLLYAQAYPQRVRAMILRGTFLSRKEDIHWFCGPNGADRLFPDEWQKFISPLPHNEHYQTKQILLDYHELLTGDDEIAKMAGAKTWAYWEAQMCSLRADSAFTNGFIEPHSALSLARLECHYFLNNAFLKPNQILRDMPRIQHIPGIIVHGRYDIVSPLDNAYALHQQWPGSELHVIREAGHLSTEPGILDVLIHATQRVAQACHLQKY